MYPGLIKTTGRNSKHENSNHTVGTKIPIKKYVTDSFHGGHDLLSSSLLCYKVLAMMYISLCEARQIL